ncbi:MAG: hypothetical protein LJF04_17410 [Gemmatimonadetes bacterium]|nr:hypothetical protein [Gemmatimonadota bacterium]
MTNTRSEGSGGPRQPAGTEGTGDRFADARALAARLSDAAGGSVEAVILYGSHILGANPDRHSALDFVLVVDGYRRFYAAMHEAGELHRPVWLFAGLANILPPNVIAYTPDEGASGLAKCLVVSRDHFTLGTSPLPRDHFLAARLVQKVAVIWAADDARRQWVEKRLAGAQDAALTWVAPWLEGSFDAETVGRKLLEVCYRSEFRPEARNRAEVVFAVQREHFRDALGRVLERAEREGSVIQASEGRLRLVSPPPPAERRRWRRYFRRSKARATARWVKHVLTFDNWLPYIVRKVERRTGRPVRLTRVERRWPLIFLWPRMIRVFMTRPEREEPS